MVTGFESAAHCALAFAAAEASSSLLVPGGVGGDCEYNFLKPLENILSPPGLAAFSASRLKSLEGNSSTFRRVPYPPRLLRRFPLARAASLLFPVLPPSPAPTDPPRPSQKKRIFLDEPSPAPPPPPNSLPPTLPPEKSPSRSDLRHASFAAAMGVDSGDLEGDLADLDRDGDGDGDAAADAADDDNLRINGEGDRADGGGGDSGGVLPYFPSATLSPRRAGVSAAASPV